MSVFSPSLSEESASWVAAVTNLYREGAYLRAFSYTEWLHWCSYIKRDVCRKKRDRDRGSGYRKERD